MSLIMATQGRHDDAATLEKFALALARMHRVLRERSRLLDSAVPTYGDVRLLREQSLHLPGVSGDRLDHPAGAAIVNGGIF